MGGGFGATPDGDADLLWKNAANGSIAEWLMANGTVARHPVLPDSASCWELFASGDFNNDGNTDLL